MKVGEKLLDSPPRTGKSEDATLFLTLAVRKNIH